jgi:hypothetical protein
MQTTTTNNQKFNSLVFSPHINEVQKQPAKIPKPEELTKKNGFFELRFFQKIYRTVVQSLEILNHTRELLLLLLFSCFNSSRETEIHLQFGVRTIIGLASLAVC